MIITEKQEEEVMKIAQDTYNIILHNDSQNNFGFVMEALIKYCDHDPIQAEQCVILIHWKQSLSIKQGSYEDLKAINYKLVNIGLKSEIR